MNHVVIFYIGALMEKLKLYLLLLKARFEAYMTDRYWNRERRSLYLRTMSDRRFLHLQTMIDRDNQYMSSDPTVKLLTERYLKAMQSDWYQQEFEDSSKLREKLPR